MLSSLESEVTLRVFIAYPGERRKEAQTLVNALKAHGIHVYVDFDLPAGDEWDSKLDGMMQDVDGVVFLVSEEYSKQYYMSEEIARAVQLYRDQGNPRLLPLQLDPGHAKLPYGLKRLTAIVSDGDMERVVAEIKAALESGPKPAAKAYLPTVHTQNEIRTRVIQGLRQLPSVQRQTIATGWTGDEEVEADVSIVADVASEFGSRGMAHLALNILDARTGQLRKTRFLLTGTVAVVAALMLAAGFVHFEALSYLSLRAFGAYEVVHVFEAKWFPTEQDFKRLDDELQDGEAVFPGYRGIQRPEKVQIQLYFDTKRNSLRHRNVGLALAVSLKGDRVDAQWLLVELEAPGRDPRKIWQWKGTLGRKESFELGPKLWATIDSARTKMNGALPAPIENRLRQLRVPFAATNPKFFIVIHRKQWGLKHMTSALEAEWLVQLTRCTSVSTTDFEQLASLTTKSVLDDSFVRRNIWLEVEVGTPQSSADPEAMDFFEDRIALVENTLRLTPASGRETSGTKFQYGYDILFDDRSKGLSSSTHDAGRIVAQ